MIKLHTVLTIAGSDSGGGAGIQADLKTFATLGVHGTCAITSITAQNTIGVLGVHNLPVEVIESQIDAIASDMDIIYAKTGMLSTSEIVKAVAKKIKEYNIPLVVDPVMSAEACGIPLFCRIKSAIDVLTKELFPIATVITPNIYESSYLSGIQIKSVEDMKKSAIELCNKGVKAVIITGGHLDATDVLYDGKEFFVLKGELIKGGTHGAGCTYAAALTANLANQKSLYNSALLAKEFVSKAIKNSIKIGKGVGTVNQVHTLIENAERYKVLKNVQSAISKLKQCDSFYAILPEVGSNIGMAIPNATTQKDVASVCGRIVAIRGTCDMPKIHPVGCVDFGASGHVARIILSAMQFDNNMRSAINIKYSKKTLDACRRLGLSISSFERKDEHEIRNPKSNVGTMEWGVETATKKFGRVPEVIYDLGEVGKEPMIRILGKSAIDVVDKVIKICTSLQAIQN
ncbi:MAG TPA: bifunctional hydroxymethylpyrimidine kinase/phosphomethylpyrimidine kinase [Methanosarcinales archaeon]|nr:bifunctional hydroxymethylpyrimidine kinase/phosphomethylpyrimidine kinase [Methanosarcinales archaeon]